MAPASELRCLSLPEIQRWESHANTHLSSHAVSTAFWVLPFLIFMSLRSHAVWGTATTLCPTLGLRVHLCLLLFWWEPILSGVRLNETKLYFWDANGNTPRGLLKVRLPLFTGYIWDIFDTIAVGTLSPTQSLWVNLQASTIEVQFPVFQV